MTEIDNAIDKPGSYIVIEVHVFNAGWYAQIDSFEHFPGEDKEIVLYKDHFIEMITQLREDEELKQTG